MKRLLLAFVGVGAIGSFAASHAALAGPTQDQANAESVYQANPAPAAQAAPGANPSAGNPADVSNGAAQKRISQEPEE